MKVPNGNLLISADFDENTKIKLGNVDIFIDDSYNPLLYSTNNGIVELLPKDYEGILKVGDRVYGNHFLCDPTERFVADGKWFVGVPIEEIYFYKRDGKLIPVEDKYLCKPIVEDDFSATIINPFKRVTDKMSIVCAIPEQETEISVGDMLFYNKHADYDIAVDGVYYLCVWNKELCQAFLPKN